MTDSGAPNSGRLAQAALEALSTHVCIVDREGRIVAANRAWREFAHENCTKPELIAPGNLYEAVLGAMAGVPPSNVETFILALREVLAGKRNSATIDHRRDGGLIPFHFRTHVTRLEVGGELAALISHEDLRGLDEAGRALSHSRTEFEALVNGIDGIIWEADACAGNFSFVNQRAESLLGYPRDAWYSPGFWQSRIFEPDREAAIAYCTEATKRLENHAFEYRMVTRDGRILWIRDIVTVVERDGRPDVLRGVMFDVTERVAALEGLRRFRAALDTSADAILLIDRESMTIVDANETAVAMTKRGRDELLALGLQQLLINVDRVLLERRFDEILESGERAVMQADVRRVDGTRFPGELRLSSLHGERELIVVSLRDVSDRLAVEESQRERERLFAALFENNNALKFLRDPVTGRIIDANPAAANFYGYAREKLLRMSVHDINPAPVSEVRAAMESAKTRKESHFEFQHRLANGEIRDVEIYSGPVALAGKRLLFSIIHDTTERKRAEADAREQRALLASQNSVLELIASDVPFDRTLSAIIEMIERAAPGALCSILLADADGETLRTGAAPGLPSEYGREIDGSPIREGGSPCAAAAFRRSLVIVEDIQTDPLWSQSRELAARCGLTSCWSNPILSGSGRVLGTFAIYYRERRRPSSKELHIIELASSLARFAIERRNTTWALRHAEEQIRQVFAASPLPIFVLDLDGHFRMWNAAAERVFGWTSADLLEAPKRVVDASNLEEFEELRNRVLRGELVNDLRVRRRRKDGSVIPLTLHVAPLLDEAGDVAGIIAVTDVAPEDRTK